jgi:hypothetical protein
MRGTLHFIAAEDARWMIELLAPRAVASAAGRSRAMGIDAKVLTRAGHALTGHLEGGRHLTRAEAYRVLEEAGIATGEQRGLHVLWCLAHEGLLCFGPRAGKQQTFVLLEEWVPGGARLRGDEALHELALRYFRGHGPATLRDFAWWSGLTLTDARRATEMAGAALSQEVIDGERSWSLPDAPGGPERPPGCAYALPAFDELSVGYSDRGAILPPQAVNRLTPFEILGRVVVLDGRVVATWTRKLVGKRVACSLSPIVPLGRQAARATRVALERYVDFLA